MGKKPAIFMVSTPLHLYNALAIALKHRHDWQSHLWFIDQKDERNPYFQVLEAWKDHPFATINYFVTNLPATMDKIRARKKAFQRIDKLVADIQPQELLVGNDRRIEFVYAMNHACRQGGLEAYGSLIDDGIYSYIDQRSRWFQDTAAERLVKKMVYGTWYQRTRSIGGSSLIQGAFVAFPEFANSYLRRLKIEGIELDLYRSPEIRTFSEMMLESGNIDRQMLPAYDLVLTLPHESLLRRFPRFQKTIRTLVESVQRGGKRVGIKYHPRQKEDDPLQLVSDREQLIPRTVAFEILLPLLDRPLILGDVSTVLLTARWLRPDLNVVALQNERDARQRKMSRILTHLGVKITGDFEEILSFLPA
ncbi:MAG: polysialyltransferase family glycosyltransferase [Syntrophotaleaceae bacterium]